MQRVNSFETWLIVGMAAVTFAIRYPFLGFAKHFELSPSVRQVLRYIPPAVLAAIIFPAVFTPHGTLDIHYTNEFLFAGGVALSVSWLRNNLLLTILAGMGALWLHILLV